MDGSQPDGHPAIQRFYQWREKARKMGHGAGGGLQTARPFLPYTSIMEYFDRPNQTERLLEALFPDNDASQLPDVGAIKETHARVFCILICTGMGHLITHFTRYPGLSDQHLPFESRPNYFPGIGKDPKYFDRFCEEQWIFSVPKFKYNVDLHFHPNEVLPIISKKEIGNGGSAVTYKIVLHEGHDRLIQDSGTQAHSMEPKDHTYVLKTYHTEDAEDYYNNEVRAFQRLKNACHTIVGFHGSFVHDGTYNVLLEYADRGTLEDYFKSSQPPKSGEDIVAFWAQLLRIVEALMAIHNDPGEDLDGPQIFQGWHQDVKPANVLVKTSEAGSIYPLKFILADLGLSHFRKKKMTSGTEAIARDAHGTRTYGAPECYRGTINEKSRLDVRRDVDIWSLGCVLSETAFWVVHGYEDLEEYRRQRKLETDMIAGFLDGNCFHDGIKVLNSVTVAHSQCVEHKRGSDHLTVPILKLVDDFMLVEPQGRLSAQNLRYRAERIIEEAKSKLEKSPLDATPGLLWPSAGLSREPSGKRPKTPPNVPPEYSSQAGSRSRPSNCSTRAPFSDPPDTSRHEIEYPRRSFSDDPYNSSSRKSAEVVRPVRRLDLNRNEIGETVQYQHLRMGKGSTSEAHSDHIRKTSMPQQSHLTDTTHRQRNSDPTPYRGHSTRTKASDGRTQHRLTSSLDQSHVPSRLHTEILEHSGAEGTTGYENHSSQSSYLQPQPEEPVPDEPRETLVPQEESRPPPPFWSTVEATEWKFRAKKNKSLAPPEPQLFDSLKLRDFVFLIDDSFSMRQHWTKAKKLLELLGWIVKRFDPDGVEVYFTSSQGSGRPRKFKSATDLVSELRNRPLKGRTDMRERLGQILETYRKKLDQPKSSISKLIAGTSSEPRRLSLCVFTDGVWQPDCDVEPLIRSIVDSLELHRLHRAQVGVQFIQFGNDKEGSRRLAHLDSGLKNPEPKQDIVDTEPADRNVLKMLFGAINPWFDDDNHDKDDATDTAKDSKGKAPATTQHAMANHTRFQYPKPEDTFHPT